MNVYVHGCVCLFIDSVRVIGSSFQTLGVSFCIVFEEFLRSD